MVANILICLQQRDWGTANNLSKIQQTSNRIRNCTNLLAAALVLHAQPCIIWGHQITDRWLGKLKHGEWRGIKERFVLFCYPAWHSILLALNNCSTYISTRPIQNEMNQVQEAPFFCPHFQGKLSEQSHWCRYWQCKRLNFTESFVPDLCIFPCAIIIPRQWIHLSKLSLWRHRTGQVFIQTLTSKCSY